MSSMGRVYPLTTLQGSSGIPNYGAFLGTAASSELISSINEQMGSTFFGTQYADTTAVFLKNIIEPMHAQAQQIHLTAEALINPDFIRPLISPADFMSIPSEMHMPILLYAPVRDLFERGRIEGFGYNSDYLPEEDIYAHILASGRVEDVGSVMDKDGTVRFHWSMRSDDPVLNGTQVRAIRDTREYIDRLLDNSEYDPTSYPNVRG